MTSQNMQEASQIPQKFLDEARKLNDLVYANSQMRRLDPFETLALALSSAEARGRLAENEKHQEFIEMVIGFCVALRQDKACWADHQDAGVLFAKATAIRSQQPSGRD